MTQADRVHSTPPTNTSAIPSRRRFLAQSAIATIAIATAVGGAGAVVSTDPIFAMIERHRELAAHCRAAYDISGRLLEGPEFDAAHEISWERHERVIEQADALISCEPATMAGVLTVIRYVAAMSDGFTPSDGWETAEGVPIDWNQAFLENVASAIESIGGLA